MAKNINKIEFLVQLDENKIPKNITWNAPQSAVKNAEAKALMVAVWDNKAQETLKMDLWTKDMPLHEMKLFYHQTLVTMADSFLRATNDEKMSATMHDFCDFFAEKTGLKKES
jgi:gliding motility-associated protein GldC